MKKMLAAFFLIFSIRSQGQQMVKSDPAAVHSVDGIIKEMLRLISGKNGETRNWEALRNLFHPQATFTVLSHGDSAPARTETVSLDTFIQLMHDPYYEQGYLERETGKTIDQYNGIAHVFQGYYGKDSENREERGINSYQLVYYSNRWWILHILWTGDSNGVKVPKRYLSQ
jgi:hypothetical protein